MNFHGAPPRRSLKGLEPLEVYLITGCYELEIASSAIAMEIKPASANSLTLSFINFMKKHCDASSTFSV